MNDNEWIELLDHLIKRLIDLGANDFANAIKQASSSRVIEPPEQRFELREPIPKASYREVGEYATRLPNPKEAFEQTLELLKVRLVMFPSIGEAVVKNLGVEPAHVVWKMEDQKYLTLTTMPEFSVSLFLLSDKDRIDLENLVNKISSLVHHS